MTGRPHPRRPARQPYSSNPPELFLLLYPDQPRPLLDRLLVRATACCGAFTLAALAYIVLGDLTWMG